MSLGKTELLVRRDVTVSVSWSSWPSSSQEQTAKRWWFEANAWCDPQAQREFLSRIDSYRGKGPTCLRPRASLAVFMDAVVIVDPVQYQRRRPGHVPGVPA
jgi:hypothetical protein